MTDRPPLVSLKGVRKAFGDKQVLDGIDLEVNRGESLVIIGGSGSGKSVMLKLIIGLMQADAGEIRIDGLLSGQGGRRQRREILGRFGMLFQGGALFDSLSIQENVAFGLIGGKGMERRKALEIAREKLAQVGLGGVRPSLSPAELSGGMQKRVALARAIATEPDIILFDEPTTGLDPIMADVINRLIVSCVAGLGATGVTITHDLASARRIASRVAMLCQGKIIWDGPADRIDNSGNPWLDQFVHGRAEGPIQVMAGSP